MRALLLAALGLVVVVGCESAGDRRARDRARQRTVPREPELPWAAPWRPPENWETMSPLEFEELVERELPADVKTPVYEDVLRELAVALDRMDTSSVRAAIFLGRSRSPAAAEILWGRLRKRQLGPERNSDAGDVLAAAALGRFPQPEQHWRLARLVYGETTHPDLEVRVESACTLLAVGFDQVIPFLLKVLRIGTWDGLADEWDLPLPPTTAWARGRAAEALSLRAGVPNAYRTDGPLRAREREACRLGELLAPAVAAATGWR